MFIIPIYNTLILPEVQYNLPLNILQGIDIEKLKQEQSVILIPVKVDKEQENYTLDDFYDIGILAEIKPNQNYQDGILTVYAKERVEIFDIEIEESNIEVSYRVKSELIDVSEEEDAQILSEIKKHITDLNRNNPYKLWIAGQVRRWNSVNEAISVIAPFTDLGVEEKYKLLETDSRKEKNTLIIETIRELVGMIEIQNEISEKEDESKKNAYREMAIHKQMELLQQELDKLNPDAVSDEDILAKKIEEAGMSEEVKKEAMRVLNRFRQEGKNGHEYGSLRDYLEFITALQWKIEKPKRINLSRAREILDKEHYGMAKVKDRVLQQLAVMALNKQQTGSILLFVGPPGTGKTSMGKSIAKALGREYVRISLGGVRDEAEIRGHRRTYVGAMPGRIMEGIKRSGVMNPVMVLDEIDKLAREYNGDPASALLEVLDPEQNFSFADHYLNVSYDLSKVLFICTANSLDTIPKPLLDRMEVIQLSGYTPVEKYHIAREHILPLSMKAAGLKEGNLTISDEVIKKIIEDYTMEAGVRGLKKQLDKVSRHAAIKIVEEKVKKLEVNESDLSQLLGRRTSSHEKRLEENTPGIVTGLAWTQAGGEILFIETTAMNGSGQIHVTGQLGEVMKESADISTSLVKSMFYGEKLDFKDKDIHIHVPAGATPKDGPSAGITLFTALTSLVTGIAVSPKIAMTGELSLRGKVMPIGGLPEKLMAAERAGIERVLIPVDNKEDLIEVPDEIKEKLEIIPVENIEEVILHALNIKLLPVQKTFFYKKAEDFKFGIPLLSENTVANAIGVGV